MKARTHYHPRTERRIVSAVLYFIAACVIAILITSCSPYTGTVTATPSQAAAPAPTGTTVEPVELTPTPRPSCTVTGYLNFRAAPNTGAAVIRVLEAGEIVTVIASGNWLKVSTGNRTGFIYSRFCEMGE